MPKPPDIKQGVETPVDLSEDEVKRLQQLQSTVKRQRKEFELKEKVLNELVKHIQETASTKRTRKVSKKRFRNSPPTMR